MADKIHGGAAMIQITPTGQACGAEIRGVDLSQPLDAQTIHNIRAAWLEHHVLAFQIRTFLTLI